MDRIGRATGPGGVEAKHSRIVAERAADTACDDIAALAQPGVLRCCNCGLAVTAGMRLPVFDRYDPILRPTTTASADGKAARARPMDEKAAAAAAATVGMQDGKEAAGKGGKDGDMVGLDYVRVVLHYDELATPSFEYSSFVACTAPCALRFAYDHPLFQPSQVPHLHANMMWERHRIDEPTIAAPSSDCLAYLNRVVRIPDQVASAAKPSALVNNVGGGLGARSFYRLLARSNLQGYKQCAPGHIPPVGDEERTALERHDARFVQYYYQDLLPPHVAAELHLPPGFEDGGVQLDANPDSDTEADLAAELVHPSLTLTPSKD